MEETRQLGATQSLPAPALPAGPSGVAILFAAATLAGMVAVTFGCYLLLQSPAAVAPDVAFSLLAIGSVTFVCSFALFELLKDAPLRGTPLRAPTSVPTARAPSRRTSRIQELRLTGGVRRTAMAAGARASVPTWGGQFAPRERPLDTEIVSPMAETPYFSGKPDPLVAFPDRDRETAPAPGFATPQDSSETSSWTSVTAPPSSRASPTDAASRGRSAITDPLDAGLSDSELDSWFPHPAAPLPQDERIHGPERDAPEIRIVDSRETGSPLSARGPSTDETLRRENVAAPTAPPSSVGNESPGSPGGRPDESAEETPARLTSPVRPLSVRDSRESLVQLEATNPIPPHLRSAPSATIGLGISGRVHSEKSEPVRPVCAECSCDLPASRAWVKCPGCSRPLCLRCLARTYLAGDEGRCGKCHSSRSSAAA